MKELDKALLGMYSVKNGALLAPLLSQLEIKFSNELDTAGTNGKDILINKKFFLSLPEKERIALLYHEVWHIARLHIIRGKNKDHELWNMACDYRINNDLYSEGIKLSNSLIDLKYDSPYLSEEEIYQILKDNSINPPQQYQPDLQDGNDSLTDSQKQEIIAKVTNAVQTAKQCGIGTNGLEELITSFVSSKIAWQTILQNYLTDKLEQDYSWSRPNRRYESIYMPSLRDEDGKLDHLVFFLDTSGSISDEQIKIFNSEIKYIFETFQPEKMSVIQFDTKIHKEDIYKEGDHISKVTVVGRGGTSLKPVYQKIKDLKPTASIIFSDMECNPMKNPHTPVIFIVYDNPNFTSSYGKVIHVETD